MIPEETRKCIEVMQAYLDGKKIERRMYEKNDFWEADDHPNWNWGFYYYRIKPQQASIPATEGELKKIQNMPYIKAKSSGNIYAATSYELAVANKSNFYIFNPDTKCWEDWENK